MFFPKAEYVVNSVTMVTDSGELRIELEEAEKLAFGNNSSHRIARITPNVVSGTWFEPAENNVVALTAADSARLMLVRDRVGKMDSTDDIFGNDVVASPVSQPLYLYDKPTLLACRPCVSSIRERRCAFTTSCP